MEEFASVFQALYKVMTTNMNIFNYKISLMEILIYVLAGSLILGVICKVAS